MITKTRKAIAASGTTAENEPIIKSDGASSDVTQWLSNNGASNITISEDDSNNLDLVVSSGLATFSNGVAFQSATTGSGTGTGFTLDSFEYGTFTPTISAESGTINGTNAVGRYTRVGNICQIYVTIEATGVSGASGAVQIGGFPFDHANVDSAWNGTPFTTRYTSLSSSVESVVARIFNNSSSGRIEAQNGTTTANLAGDVQNGTTFLYAGSYLV